MPSQVPAKSAWAKGPPPVKVPGAPLSQAQPSLPATTASGSPIHTSNGLSIARPSVPSPPFPRPPFGVPIPPPQWGYYHYPSMQMDPNHYPYQIPPWTLPQHLPPLPLGALAPRPPPLWSSPAAQPRPEPPEPSSGVGVSPRATPKVNTFVPKLRVTIKSESGQELDLEKWREFTSSQALVRRKIQEEQRARIVAGLKKESKASKAARKAMRRAERARLDAEWRAQVLGKQPIPSEVDRPEQEVETPLDTDEGKVAQEETDEGEEGLWKKIEWDLGSEREEADDVPQEADEKAQGQASATPREELELELLGDELDFPVAEETVEEHEHDAVSELKTPLWSTFTSENPKRNSARPRLRDSESKDPSDHRSASSVLAKAQPIQDIGSARYLEGVTGPKADLNVNAAPGKFRYDRDFLFQFMSFCKDKPDSFLPLDEIGIAPLDETWTRRDWHGSRPRSSSRRSTLSLQPPPGSALGAFTSTRLPTNPFALTVNSGTHLLSRPPSKVRGDLSDFSKLVKRVEPSFLWSRSRSSESNSKSTESAKAAEGSMDPDSCGNASATAERSPVRATEGFIDSNLTADQIHFRKGEVQKTGKPASCKTEFTTDSTFANTSRDLRPAQEQESPPGHEGGGPSARGMSDEEANKRVNRTVTMLSGLHNIATVLCVFQDLRPEYHSRLVHRLVSHAIKCNADGDAQVTAYFLHCPAERRVCSPAAFEDGISMTASTLETIAEEFPDAISRYATVIQGTGIHEDSNWRARLLGRAGIHGPELESRLLCA